jgi:hypothetical protein
MCGMLCEVDQEMVAQTQGEAQIETQVSRLFSI